MKTLLFVPANRPEYFEKIARFKPDGVIADLEDAVPEHQKARARQNLSLLAKTLTSHDITLLVRVNSNDQHVHDDLDAAIGNGANILVIPKANSPEQVAALDRIVGYLEGKHGLERETVKFLLIPETAFGLSNLYTLCKASSRVNGTMTPVSGPVAGDVARAVGYQPTLAGAEQLYVQGRVILESRAAGEITPYAGIIGIDLSDQDAAQQLINRARTLGFDGVALTHPSHVEIARHVYESSETEIEDARQLIAAYDEAVKTGRGAIRFKNAMVDLAMVERAKDLIKAQKASE